MTQVAPRFTIQRVKIVSELEIDRALAVLPGCPRVIASGNLATPRKLLEIADAALERYRLFMLAAQAPLPVRPEVIFETAFVGPGMRDAGERLDYLPMRLGLVPRLFRTSRRPDVVLRAHLFAGRREGVARDRGEHPPRGDRKRS